MARFGMRYDWRTAPLAFGLGLLPPLTYVDVDDERVRVQLGPWFVLQAPRALIRSADIARGELPAIPAEHRTTPDGYSRLLVRTSSGTLVRIRFTERPSARIPIGPPLLRPRFAPLNLNPSVALDEIALSVADPERLAMTLG